MRCCCLFLYYNFFFIFWRILETDLGLTDSAVETVWGCLKTGKENILLGCVYRPGDSSDRVNKQINHALAKARDLVSKNLFNGMIIVGDFNYWDLEWDDFGHCSPTRNSEKTKVFKENIEEKWIYQNVNFKTFQKTENELTNTLDLIFTENSERISELVASPPLGNIEKAHLVLKWNFIMKNSRLENRS